MQLGRIAQRLLCARKIEIAGAVHGKIDVDHRRQRHAHDQLEVLAERPHEDVHLDVGGNVVRGGEHREREQSGHRCHCATHQARHARRLVELHRYLQAGSIHL